MRVQPQARTVRLSMLTPRRRWSSWITLAILSRRTFSQERLELIERLASERRRALKSEEYLPGLGRQPRRF
jgi:hypothetical protein